MIFFVVIKILKIYAFFVNSQLNSKFRLINKAIETAKKNNCYKVILLSGIARKEAHQFYENLGFSSETKKAFDMRI